MSRLSAFVGVCLLLLGAYSANADPITEVIEGVGEVTDDLRKDLEKGAGGSLDIRRPFGIDVPSDPDWIELRFGNKSNAPIRVWVIYWRYISGRIDAKGWSQDGPWVIQPGQGVHVANMDNRVGTFYYYAEPVGKKGFTTDDKWSGKLDRKLSDGRIVGFRRGMISTVGGAPRRHDRNLTGTVNYQRIQPPQPPPGPRPDSAPRDIRYRLVLETGVLMEGMFVNDRLVSERPFGGRFNRDTRIVPETGLALEGAFINNRLVAERELGHAQAQIFNDGREYWVFQNWRPLLRQ